MRRARITALSMLGAAVLVAGSFYAGRHSSGSMATPMTSAPAASVPVDKKVLYWHDPMVPGQRFDKTGKSPFMDMQLVPIYSDSDSGDGGVKVSATVQQNLGIRTAAVQKADVSSSFDAVSSSRASSGEQG